MKIYTYPKSRSLRALWTLEEIGAPYEAIKVDLFGVGQDPESPHPRAKVPFLTDGNISIAETAAICVYLCEKYGRTTLYPSDPQEKSSVNAWLSYALTDLESPVWSLLKQLVFTPENQRSAELVNHFRSEASKAVSLVRLNQEHGWVAGSRFTLADIFISHNLLWAKLCGITLHAELESYLDRALTRPAFLRAQQRNNQ